MELIVINQNKLKIMLNSDDMKRFGMGSDNVPCSRELLKVILCEAGLEDNFEGNKFFIQMYPARLGGCEMFVTKLNTDTKEIDTMPAYNEQGMIQIKSIRKAPAKKSVLTYTFKKIDWLIGACRELLNTDFSGESALYKDQNNIYYLFLSCALLENEKNDTLLSLLSEFGESEFTEYASLYVNENGNCICSENAVEILGKL